MEDKEFTTPRKPGAGKDEVIVVDVPPGPPIAKPEPDIVITTEDTERDTTQPIHGPEPRGHSANPSKLRVYVGERLGGVYVDGAEVLVQELERYGNTRQGFCEFSNVPPGNYSVQVQCGGRRQIKRITLESGQSVLMSFYVED